MNSKSIEIDLFDMLKEAIKKWKWILLCLIICALLCGVYGVYQSKKPVPNSAEEIKDLKLSLTEEQIKSVEDTAEIINSYRDMYEKQKEYNENSIYQNLNPYGVDTLTLSYYVDNHYQVSYPVIQGMNNLTSMTQTYASIFAEDEFYNELVKSCGLDANPIYIKELVTVNAGSRGDAIVNDTGVITIIIYADSNELLSDIGDFVKNKILDKKDEMAELYGEHDVVLTSETISKTVDVNMVELQNVNLARLSDITNNISSAEKMFSGAQRTYLSCLVHEDLQEEVSIVKCVAIGAAVGAIASFVYFCLAYVFSKSIKTANELVNTFNLSIIGGINDNRDLLTSKINRIVKITGGKKIAIVTEETNSEIESFVQSLGNQYVFISDLLNSKESIDEFVTCDYAILIVEIKKSLREDVKSVLAICKDLGVKEIGVLIK